MKECSTTFINKFTIHKLELSELGSNCYVVQRGPNAILVDPTTKASEILEFLKSKKININLLIATHGHFDHISAAQQIIDAKMADALFVHQSDIIEVKKARSYMMMVLRQKMHTPKCNAIGTRQLSILEEMGLTLRHVGGHSKGSCVIHATDFSFLISGDLILHHSLNLTEFNKTEIKKEFLNFGNWIKSAFKPSATIFTGHGPNSTVEQELFYNRKCLTEDKLEK